MCPRFAFAVGVLVLAPPSRAQVNLGPVTVGAGLRTSFVHTEPDGGDSTDQFLLNDVRLYVNGPVTDKIKFMFNTDYDGATNKIGVLDAVARIEVSPEVQHLGRPLPAAERPRESLRPVLRARVGRVYGRHPGRISVRLSRPRQRRRLLGRLRQESESLGRRVRRRVRDRESRSPRGRPRPDRFLGSGGRLLPERHLLRRQEPAGHRRSDSGSGRQHGDRPSISSSRGNCPTAASFSIESEYANYNRLGGYDAAYAKSQGAYGLGSYLFPKAGRHGQVRDPRQVRQGGVYARRNARTTTRRPPKSTSTTSSSSSTRA